MLPDFRVRQRDYLLEITRALSEELEFNRVLARIVRVAAELLAGRACLIVLRGEEGWHVGAAYGIEPAFLRRVDRMMADIPLHEDPERLELPEVDARVLRIAETTSLGLLSSVRLPLIAGDELIGVIFVLRAYQSAFTARDRGLLQAFASQAAIAVHNARLYTQLARQKDHLDAVVESSADGIFILDRGLRFTRFNPACVRMTHYPEEEVLQRGHAEIVQWKELTLGPTLEEAVAQGWPLAEATAIYVEGGLKRKDGGELSVGITYAPILSNRQHLSSVVANVRDITRFREAEELKSTFISIISHELRTPVALIKGYVGTLRREDARWDQDVTRESLAVIEEETDRLSGLIDDLLDASRLQSGTLSLKPSEVDIEQLMRRVATRFATQSDSVTIGVDLAPDLPLLFIDESRLTQVLNNLLSNAVKYSSPGGRIEVRGELEAGEVVVCVEDEGPGIEPEYQAKVFERFYRVPETAAQSKGAGLGLYLSKAIVEAHGGKIWVDPERRKGTRVCFSLPVERQQAPRISTQP